MSRVHDALRRAEMGGMMPPEEPSVDPAESVPVNPDLRPPDGGVNGAATAAPAGPLRLNIDRKSTRLNSSHLVISDIVFCLIKKNILDYNLEFKDVSFAYGDEEVLQIIS